MVAGCGQDGLGQANPGTRGVHIQELKSFSAGWKEGGWGGNWD